MQQLPWGLQLKAIEFLFWLLPANSQFPSGIGKLTPKRSTLGQQPVITTSGTIWGLILQSPAVV
jgi:hypothetical protein